MENVPQVTSSELWPELLSRLSRMGYVNEYKDLDSSRFGSAQKRVRTFMLSRLGRFPPSLPTSTDAPPRCIRDIMEDEVEERFIRRIPLERIKWREPIKGYRHPQSEGIDCPLLDASDPRLETRRIASEESLCPTLRTGVSVRVVSEEEEERAKALCEKADNVRLAPKGEKSIGTTSEGGTRLVVSPEEQRRKAGIDRDAELVEEHFRMAKGPGDRVRHEDGFEEGSSRKEGGLYSVQKEDGHVRFYRGNQAKAGLSEAQYYPADSQSPAVTSSHPPKVLDVEGGIGVLADIKKGGRMQNNRLHDPLGQSPALRTHGGGDHDIKAVVGIETSSTPVASIEGETFYSKAMLYSSSSSPTLRLMGRHGRSGLIKVIDRVEPSSTPVAEMDGETFYSRRMLYSSSSSPTIRTFHSAKDMVKVVDGEDVASGPHGLSRGDLIVRVLTPLECWRLMGFPDWAYEKASKVSSETQLYNQAGNSIVVEVLEAIFKTMVEPPKAEQSMLTRWLRWMPSQS